jgi:MFS family permease
MAIDLAASTAGGALSVLVVLISIDQVGGGEEGVGYLNAATGVGGVLAGIVGGILVLRRLDLPLALGAILGGLGLAVLGFTRDLGPALVVIGVALGGITLLDIVNVTLLQRLVPDDRRGRAVGILQTAATAGFIVGSFMGPILAGVIGIPAVLVGAGAALLATGVAVLVVVRPTGVLGRPDVALGRIGILERSGFAGAPPARLEAAAQRLVSVVVQGGQVIIREGDTPDRFYMIERGTVAVSQRGEGGIERALREMGPGEVFGEIGLLRAIPRTATVTALTEGVFLALEREPFLELVSTGPGLSSRLLDLHRGALSTAHD